ncbi:sulfatase-like hydrolase/transferase [Rubinisphaera margarita]|uniref:sulfatase-like hydrolase/transferase n=1 Tax=Rubinisphaera margarita TaxID=2909586 RepID=UPI001EE99DEB|nr:sulfatase-like hydrolase/transferase [Rubinisphaera margarita]MCG6157700.1 sulfatase-like hydrolase/transferase [Rubinisphaera margarita]
MPRWTAFAAALLISTMFTTDAPAAESGDRPNVILILADDLAPGDFSSVNGGLSRTPRLDQLAATSVQFTQAYSGSAVCAPARACLLTGRYPQRTGVVSLNMNKYPELTSLYLDEVTIADVFRDNGYRTGLIGKWHCGSRPEYHPLKRGFDEFEGFGGSADLGYFNYSLDVNGEMVEVEEGYLTDDLSERAVNFVRRNQNRPFFLHLAHYAPHRPLHAPEELIASYEQKGLPRKTATIYAMIEIMDRGIGELLDELDRLDLAEQTIVIFASDNGPDPLTGERFNRELRGTKYEIYEGGIRVPLLMRWSEQWDAGEQSRLVHFADLFPTLIDLCGIAYEPKSRLDGVSFAGVLNGETQPDPVRFWQWNRGEPNYSHNAAMRDGSWKLVRPFMTRNELKGDSTARPVLYNLAADPEETTDVSARQPNRYRQMQRQLEEWTESIEQDRTRKP